MGLGGSLVGGNFEVIIQEANHKGMGTFLCGGGGLIPRDFNLAIREGLGWVKWFKNGGRERFYTSCSYSCIILFWVKILSVSLMNFNIYNLVCLNLNHEKTI